MSQINFDPRTMRPIFARPFAQPLFADVGPPAPPPWLWLIALLFLVALVYYVPRIVKHGWRG